MIYPPEVNPAPYNPDAYAYDSAAYNTDAYAYDPAAYDTDAYAAGYLEGRADQPYYDTDPVQFAYTPADIPPRAPVVRPDPERPSQYSLILPRHARNGLYELVSQERPSTNTAHAPVQSEASVPDSES